MFRRMTITALAAALTLGLMVGCSMQQKGATARQGVNSAKRRSLLCCH